MTWTAEIATGIPEIDRQHQYLYVLAESLHDAMRTGDREAVPAIVARLHEFAEAHFATEERHMAELRYPQLADHRVAHESFVADLRTFEVALSKGVRASVILDLAHFLTSWMRDHIRANDVPFGRWAARDDRRLAPASIPAPFRPLAPAR